MGDVKRDLFRVELPEREKHNSRMFIDLAENIHIHHREFRTVFSLSEYFEYADILNRSTADVKNYLASNPDYEEGKYPTTIMIAGGKKRQFTFLENSPAPNKSAYYEKDFAIELQEEYVTDEVHIHYRDFRIAMNREKFRVVANGFRKALAELNEFEFTNKYVPELHFDKRVAEYNKHKPHFETQTMGVESIRIKDIESHWYNKSNGEWVAVKNFVWSPNKEMVSMLRKAYKNGDPVAPILLCETKMGYEIVDGHHRYYAAWKEGMEFINTVVIEMEFRETMKIREAINLLRSFDKETSYQYNLSSFVPSFFANKFNTYYNNSFSEKIKRMKPWRKFIRRVKRKVSKRLVFKTFNEGK